MSIQRGILHHTWLENGILNKGIAGVMGLWLDGVQWTALDVDFPIREIEAKKFGDRFIDEFSSGNLVDRLFPTQGLPQDVRTALRQALDSRYRKKSKLPQLQSDYRVALGELKDNLASLRLKWNTYLLEDEVQMQMIVQQVFDTASTLKKVIEQIPSGVVIP